MLNLSNIEWLNWLTNLFVNVGEKYKYLNFFIGTFLEACGIPFASMPAFTSTGYLISEGKFNFFWAVAIGAIGNTLGSAVSYWIGRQFGKIVRKKHKDHNLTQRDDRLETYIRKHGAKTIFWAQVWGFTRTFISFPAGMLKMDFKKFIISTFFGGILFVIYFSIGAIYIREIYDKFVYPYIGLSFASLGLIFGFGYIITHLSFHYGRKAHHKIKEYIDGQDNED